MGKPVGFEGANEVLRAPKSQPECGDLEIMRAPDCLVSCWRFTEAELANIQRTGVVWLTVEGKTHPPLSISGEAGVLIGGRPAKAEPFIEKAARRAPRAARRAPRGVDMTEPKPKTLENQLGDIDAVAEALFNELADDEGRAWGVIMNLGYGAKPQDHEMSIIAHYRRFARKVLKAKADYEAEVQKQATAEGLGPMIAQAIKEARDDNHSKSQN